MTAKSKSRGVAVAILLCLFSGLGAGIGSADVSMDAFATFERVSARRVSRFVTEFVYRARATNGAEAIEAVSATVTSASARTTIVDGDLEFDDLAPGQTAASIDTFSFRHDRRVPFDPTVLAFAFGFVPANSRPIANAGPDQTVFLAENVTLDGSGSTDGDGDPLTFRWAFASLPAGSAALLSDPAAVMPTFVVDAPGRYVVELIVNDGIEDSLPDSVAIDTVNSPPVADAGPDSTAFVSDTVTLDGSGSSDVDGDPLTFSWTFTSVPIGSSAALSDPAAVMPSFVVDLPGTYVIELVVDDGLEASAPDEVRIDTENSPPVAETGDDQTVFVTDLVTLDGSRSSDVDGDPLAFSWSLASIPIGSGAVLDDPSLVMPSFTVDLPGTYVAQLIVNDGLVDSVPDTVTVVTANTAPVADAGIDQTAFVTDTVTLDGTGSSDVDGDALSMAWSFVSVPPGSAATLTNPAATMPRFDVDLPGVYVVQLIVNDGTVDSAPDTVMITTINSPPVANAGVDQVVFLAETVQLDGTASFDVDLDPLTYFWALTTVPAGSGAVLDDPTVATPTFEADLAGTYIAQLIVNDGALDSDPDHVVIVTNNSPPTADAGPNQTVPLGATVTLDGSGSRDVDGDPLTYRWRFLSIPASSAAVLSDPASASPSFIGDVDGDYEVELVVNDGSVDSDPDTVRITVEPAPALTPFSRLIGAGLQFRSGAGLEVSNHGGVTVRIESNDPAVALVAPDEATPGSAAIDVFVPAGSDFAPYVVQGVLGASGVATVTATAPGFATGRGTITIAAPVVFLTALSSTASVGVNDAFVVFSAVPSGSLLSFQGMSAANSPPVDITVESSDPASAVVEVAGNRAGSVTFTPAPGEFQTTASFVPLATGTPTVSVSAPGFGVVATSTQTVTVGPPRITLFTRTIGSGLQFVHGATLDTSSHGGVTVRIESSNPAIALVTPDALTPGSPFIDVFVPDGSNFVPYGVQGVLGAAGDVTITGSASGFAAGASTASIVPAAIQMIGLTTPLTAGGADAFSILVGIANGSGTGLSSLQQLSAANIPPVEITVSSSDGTVGQLTFDGVTSDSVVITTAAMRFQFIPRFEALAAGTTLVSISAPNFLSIGSLIVTVVP